MPVTQINGIIIFSENVNVFESNTHAKRILFIIPLLFLYQFMWAPKNSNKRITPDPSSGFDYFYMPFTPIEKGDLSRPFLFLESDIKGHRQSFSKFSHCF